MGGREVEMQIVIPMTGYGSRFKEAGYDRLKPFIEVHGQPLIEWVLKMFPGEQDQVLLICRQEHLDTLDYMKPILDRVAKKARIFPIKDWQKKGPVFDVLCASDVINDKQPVLVSYCDYYMHWDYKAFKLAVQKRHCAGAILCYTGFHPHLIPSQNVYASCKVDRDENLIEVREKFSYEKDKTKALHSVGLYYLETGHLMKKYYQKMICSGDSINGEYYASLPYNDLVQDGLKVWCPSFVSHFCQWGSPQDLQDYLFWINTIKGFNK